MACCYSKEEMIGSSDKVVKTTWHDVSCQITKINMYKHQRLRKAALKEEEHLFVSVNGTITLLGLTDSMSSDNAGGIAEMAGMSHKICERTDALGDTGNTTSAIRKGFAIGSGAIVSLVLFGAFVSRAGVKVVDVLPEARQPPPLAPIRDGGGSMFGGIGSTIVEGGMVWHLVWVVPLHTGEMAVDAILGPRTIPHETVVSEAVVPAPVSILRPSKMYVCLPIYVS
ncbi:Pyrophosphate-energized vacuolar membrane proton pump [Zea mays]|uniref:H(+)-exporting diphosphatase n=1 Tax=Zea mays TaxID=4577 RepID=A0A3L6FIL8_MAIZE|nr:Pyrophosphate-energized vacuolar membrane proton pump [Zea mays]